MVFDAFIVAFAVIWGVAVYNVGHHFNWPVWVVVVLAFIGGFGLGCVNVN